MASGQIHEWQLIYIGYMDSPNPPFRRIFYHLFYQNTGVMLVQLLSARYFGHYTLNAVNLFHQFSSAITLNLPPRPFQSPAIPPTLLDFIGENNISDSYYQSSCCNDYFGHLTDPDHCCEF